MPQSVAYPAPHSSTISMTEATVPQDHPKTIGSTPARPDETPADFAGLTPPGYWSATLDAFVPVRVVSEEEFWERSFLGDAIKALAH